ncbi:hypothetical protein LZ30DRAFT_15990 [Colletotrichum cereale]|nr:hypothetical protein LZ30DRAFT_15990 [Colletotrichum cereale]
MTTGEHPGLVSFVFSAACVSAMQFQKLFYDSNEREETHTLFFLKKFIYFTFSCSASFFVVHSSPGRPVGGGPGLAMPALIPSKGQLEMRGTGDGRRVSGPSHPSMGRAGWGCGRDSRAPHHVRQCKFLFACLLVGLLCLRFARSLPLSVISRLACFTRPFLLYLCSFADPLGYLGPGSPPTPARGTGWRRVMDAVRDRALEKLHRVKC